MVRYVAILTVVTVAGVVMEYFGIPDWWRGVIVGGVLVDALNRPCEKTAVEYDSHGYPHNGRPD